MWGSICKRVVLPISSPPPMCDSRDCRSIGIGISIDLNRKKPLEGIIAHLTRQCGGNVHDRGL
jgi:hypothetical protein